MNWFAILAAISTIAAHVPEVLQSLAPIIEQLKQQHPPAPHIAALVDQHLADAAAASEGKA
jgi:hypothetical protein